jgi:CrcB protein
MTIGGFFCVGLGGALGAMARVGLGQVLARQLGAAMPWGTLAANLLGGLAIGYLAGRWGTAEFLGRPWLMLAAPGFLGGFTTFSAFSIEVVGMADGGALFQALVYTAASVVGALALAWLGISLGRLS